MIVVKGRLQAMGEHTAAENRWVWWKLVSLV
jgi:hypothetical protein